MEVDREGRSGASFPSAMPHLQFNSEIQSRSFYRSISSISSNPAFIQRLELQRELEGHNGCVNTCTFLNSSLILTGSDDLQIKVWNWQDGSQLFSWDSGHWSNVFEVKVLPDNQNSSSNSPPAANLTVVSSAADGQIRLAHVFEGRVTHRRVGSHDDSVHKLALCPDTPWTFLSCGGDGGVNHYDLRLPRPSSRLMTVYLDNIRALNLYSIACNPRNPTEFCIGGNDEAVRVFDLRKITTPSAKTAPAALPLAFFSPRKLVSSMSVGVTAAVYSCKGEILASYNDENIYLINARRASGIAGGYGSNDDDDEEGIVSFNSSRRPSSSRLPPTGTTHGARDTTTTTRNTRSSGRRRGDSNLDPAGTGSNRGRGGRGQRRTGRGRGGRVGERGNRHQAAEERDTRWHNRNQRAEARPEEKRAVVRLDTVLQMRYFKITGEQYNRNTSGQNRSKENEEETEEISSDSFLAQLYAAREGNTTDIEDGNLDLDSDSDEIGVVGTGDSNGSNDNGDSSDSDDGLSQDSLFDEAMYELTSFIRQESSDEEADDSSDREEGFRVDASLLHRWPIPRLCNWNVDLGLVGVPTSRESGEIVQMYQGHRNEQTIKGVSFFGANDEWVVSGSDCGYMYFWSTTTGDVVASFKGDSYVVNCLERHPQDIFTLATSGIDDSVKIWSCSAPERVEISPKDRRRMKANIKRRERRPLFAYVNASESEDSEERE